MKFMKLGFFFSSYSYYRFNITTIRVFHSIFQEFKQNLFQYYLNYTSNNEEMTMVLENYKQLIRIQDEQLQTFDLLKKGGNAGIEMIEDVKKKDELIEEMKKKEVTLEQEVFDWKERFSKKEIACREKEQECEQFEYSLQTLQVTANEEKKQYEEEIEGLKKELEIKANEYQQYTQDREQESSSMMIALNKKQDQITFLNETMKEYENTIDELRKDLQAGRESVYDEIMNRS